jgi:hypothetical protein
MIDDDIVGGALDDTGRPLDESELRCFSGPTGSRQLARLAKVVLGRRVPEAKLLLQETIDRPGRGGDHMSFERRGVPSIRLIEGHERAELQHTARDERVHLPFLELAARANVALVHDLACAPPAPGAPAVERGRITWSPVDGAVRYLLGIRKSDLELASVREHTECSAEVETGPETHASVAAVDARGNVSLFSPETTGR